MNTLKTVFRVHAMQRMFERKVSLRNVSLALQFGETIEDYSTEMPEAGRLILGFHGNRPFHVVVSENLETNEITVITVYIPHTDKWHKDWKSRKS